MSPLDTNTTGLKVKQKWGQRHYWTLTLQGQKMCGAQWHYWARINAGAMTLYRAGDVCVEGGGRGLPLQGQMTLAVGAKTVHGSRLPMGQVCICCKAAQKSQTCRGQGYAHGHGCAQVKAVQLFPHPVFSWLTSTPGLDLLHLGHAHLGGLLVIHHGQGVVTTHQTAGRFLHSQRGLPGLKQVQQWHVLQLRHVAPVGKDQVQNTEHVMNAMQNVALSYTY